jgi:hypothetical protein
MTELQKSRWRYVGPGKGHGGIHMVLEASPHDIVTYSDMGSGWSWRGGGALFRQHFQQVLE